MKKTILAAALSALLLVIFTFGTALAHESVHVGNYEVEIGWLNEPAVAGQRNAIVVNVADGADATRDVDVSKLVVNIAYGDQTKTLTLQPLSEEAKNQYIAPILPTIPGKYTIQLRGKLGETDVSTDVEPEEVLAADTISFPSGQGAPGQRNGGFGGGNFGGGFGLTTWLSGGALLVALVALALGILALRKSRS